MATYSGVGSWLQQLERMSSSSVACVTFKELGMFQVYSRIEYLVESDHITTSAPVVQRGDFELPETFTVGQVPDAPYKSGCTPLNFLHEYLVSTIEGSP